MTDKTDIETPRVAKPTGPGLHALKAPRGANRRPKRVGRGSGSGHGGTSTYGHKGQTARTSPDLPRGYEGGQMPLQRRIPKRGFWNRSRRQFAIVNLPALEVFDAGSVVDTAALKAKGIVRNARDGIKVLGDGEISKALTVKVERVSASAKEKIEKAGGQVILVGKSAPGPTAEGAAGATGEAPGQG